MISQESTVIELSWDWFKKKLQREAAEEMRERCAKLFEEMDGTEPEAIIRICKIYAYRIRSLPVE